MKIPESRLAGTAWSLHKNVEPELDHEGQMNSTSRQKKRRNYFYFEIPEIQRVK